jgi:membrane-associated phospholipid phosphatase
MLQKSLQPGKPIHNKNFSCICLKRFTTLLPIARRASFVSRRLWSSRSFVQEAFRSILFDEVSMRVCSLIAVLVALLFVPISAGGSRVSADDIVLQWNRTVLNSIRAERTAPPVAARNLAMTHIAIYDALNEIEGSHRSYSYTFPGVSLLNPSPNVSASTAAYIVLSHLYPTRESIFRTQWLESFNIGDGTVRNTAAVAWGTYVGNLVINYRSNDGSNVTRNYTPLTGCGKWKPTFPAFAPALLPQWPRVQPFGVTNVAFFRAAAPPSLTSAEFGKAYKEVQSLGSVNSKKRTKDQTQIAYFWEDGGGSVTPPGHWQVIAQDLSAKFLLSRVENARLFALLSIAQADAAISCWDSKYAHNYFRPITGIREKCFSRKDLVKDPAWTPLLPTPPFPAYTSGHSTFSGASARILALYFGTDKISFSGASPDPERWPAILTGVTRKWSSLSKAAAEAGQSRIYGGIHWQFDNTVGLKLGQLIAEQTYDIHLRPE